MTSRPRAVVDGGSRRRRLGRVAWAVGCLALLLTLVPIGLPATAGPGAVLAPASADPPVVIGDGEQDAYVGFGAFLLPASAPLAARQQAAACFGCQWRLTLACPQAEDGACPGVVAACDADQQWMRVWVAPIGSSQPPGGSAASPEPAGWVRIAVTCLGPDAPVTVEEMTRRVTEEMRALLPPLEPAAQPPSGAVARLPMIFRSGQPAREVAVRLDLLGFGVDLRAACRWTWTFGDGARLTTSDPGGRWPHRAVEHVFRSAGERTVAVRARWTAWFTVDGLGPFDVRDAVEQEASLPVAIGEGRAVLVQ